MQSPLPAATVGTSAAPTTAAPTTTTTVVVPTTAAATTTTPTTVRRVVVTTVPRTVPKPAAPAPVHAAVTAPKQTPAPVVSGASPTDFALIGYRWNPCTTITVSSSGPDVSGIVSELASITGLHLVMTSGLANITVAWGSVPLGGEVGQAAWNAIGAFLTSVIVTISPAAQPYLSTILRHELGHALGLAHAHQSNEVMYPTVGPYSPTDYQAGDIAGLRAVGANGSC